MSYKIGIIGLGYVGLPLAHAFSKKYKVIGFDIDQKRVEELNKGIDSTLEIEPKDLKSVLPNYTPSLKNFYLTVTSQFELLNDCNIYIVTVPTPIDNNNRPYLKPLLAASKTVAKVLKKDDIVIYESTVYPGVTEEICVPVLEKESKLKFNSDFFCGYSPERINPGDKTHTLTKILKVTSGSTPEVADKIDELYKSIITAGTHKCSSIKVAEACKVIENTQRDVNIALINELSMIFHTMEINTHEVLAAAATKWNFISLKPGLVGGHCIGVDPYYLTFKAKELGYTPNLILSARQINNGMGKYIAERVIKLMIKKEVHIKNAKVLILGITFKENCPDIRNTKVIDIINEIKEYDCQVDVADYWADPEEVRNTYHLELKNDFNTQDYNAIVVAVGHDKYKQIRINMNTQIVFDVKSILNEAHARL